MDHITYRDKKVVGVFFVRFRAPFQIKVDKEKVKNSHH
jgi:hypothetical protein